MGNTNWTLLSAPHCGHKLWKHPIDGRIALTDWSLRVHGQPQTTDDGLLLVNTQAKIAIDNHGAFLLPLLKGDNNKRPVATVTNVSTVLVCLRMLGMKLALSADMPDGTKDTVTLAVENP